jgi:hypothetical protein
MSPESAEAIALFRYRVIAEGTSPRLSPAERGRLVRELARQLHEHPDGSQRETRAARSTAGSAPISSKAWRVSSRSHAPTWVRSVGIRSC